MNKHCSLLFAIAFLWYTAVFAQAGTGSAPLPDVSYTTAQKLHFIDSVKNADLRPAADYITHWPDSVFRNRRNMNIVLRAADFSALKRLFAAHPGSRTCNMAVADAARIFKGFDPVKDSVFVYQDSVALDLIPLGKSRLAFDEYAICIGDRSAGAWDNDVYFFRNGHLVALHHIDHHYGIEMDHFKDAKGRTMVYYRENFGTGSGIWQFNYYFYVYDGYKLTPALNVLQNGNFTWEGPRNFWLETKVIRKLPLTLKFAYHFSFGFHRRPDMVNTYDIVTYRQDKYGRYTGDYAHAKISPQKMVTYCPDADELLFIQAYYPELKSWLSGSSKARRKYTLEYINKVMNSSRDRQ